MKVFGTSREGSRILLTLMVPWSAFMAFAFHDTPKGLDMYFVFGLPLAIAAVYLARHRKFGRRGQT